MEIDKYKKTIQNLRGKLVEKPKVLVTKVFDDLDMDSKDKDYFLGSPSDFVIEMRNETWKRFLVMEERLNEELREILWRSSETISNMDETVNITKKEELLSIIVDVANEFGEHLFELNKSNTNSRRARAGKEFEAIFEKLILILLIRYDLEGSVGQDRFRQAGLSKLVDFVIPGVSEYNLEKHKCALVSMKTSLRERWQEVPEELSRTGAHLMYLFTLDPFVSSEVIDSLHTHNIKLVVLDQYKEQNYRTNLKVYGLKKLITELLSIMDYWNTNITELIPSDPNYLEDKIRIYSDRFVGNTLEVEKKINAYHVRYFEGLE